MSTVDVMSTVSPPMEHALLRSRDRIASSSSTPPPSTNTLPTWTCEPDATRLIIWETSLNSISTGQSAWCAGKRVPVRLDETLTHPDANKVAARVKLRLGFVIA